MTLGPRVRVVGLVGGYLGALVLCWLAIGTWIAPHCPTFGVAELVLFVATMMVTRAAVALAMRAGLLSRDAGWAQLGWEASPRFVEELVFGAATGVLLVGGLACAMVAFDGGHFERVRAVSLGESVDAVIAFVIIAVDEELAFRGFLYRVLAHHGGDVMLARRRALLLTSVLFAMLHLGNPHVTWWACLNLVVAGVFLGAALLTTGRLAFGVGAHFTWNLTIRALGLPVSGLEDRALLAHYVAPATRPDAMSDIVWGGAFGPEGGVAGTLALVVGVVIGVLVGRRAAGSTERAPERSAR